MELYRRHDADCPLLPEGMRSDIKKCDCQLWVHGSDGGRRLRKSLKTRSIARGLERLVRIEREPAKLLPIPLDKAVALYLADCRTRNIALSSIRAYATRLRPLVSFFPGASVRDLTTERVATFRAARPAGKAPASIRLGLIVLRTFLRFCLDRGWLASNPSANMKLPRPNSEATLPYTADEVSRLIAACDRLKNLRARLRARALVLLLLYSGLRISDAMKLERSAVDFKTGKVLLRIMKTKQPFYGKLPPEALTALEALPLESAYFLWSGNSRIESAIDAARKTMVAVGKHAGVPGVRPHRFRDTFAVELLLNGVEIRTVQLLLGHSSVVTTERHYAPYVARMQRVVDEAVSGLHFGSSPQAVVDPLGHTDGNPHRNTLLALPAPRRISR